MIGNGIPLLLPKIQQIEETLLTDNMIGRIYESQEYKQWVTIILGILNYSRQYYALGYIRKAYRSYLRAYCLCQELCKKIGNVDH